MRTVYLHSRISTHFNTSATARAFIMETREFYPLPGTGREQFRTITKLGASWAKLWPEKPATQGPGNALHAP